MRLSLARVVPFLTGVLLIATGTSGVLSSFISLFMTILGAIIIVSSIAVELFGFLQTAEVAPTRSQTFDQRISELEDELRSIITELESVKALKGGDQPLTEQERAELKTTILTQVHKDMSTAVQQDVLRALKAAAASERYVSTIRELAQNIQTRLGREIRRLTSTGNLNLIIGIIISMIGLGGLGYVVFTVPSDILLPGNERQLAGYFLTRLSLVAFIEVFAYFFLRLYRYSLFEIKYFQNEMTNAESRLIALEAALMGGDNDTIKKVCMEMSRTERNFILKKGETTVGIRTVEAEEMNDKTLTGLIETVLSQREQTGAKKKPDAKPKIIRAAE